MPGKSDAAPDLMHLEDEAHVARDRLIAAKHAGSTLEKLTQLEGDFQTKHKRWWKAVQDELARPKT